MRVLRHILLFWSVVSPLSAFAPPRRPEISEIALVSLRVTNPEASHQFYAKTLGLPQGTQGCFSPAGSATCFFLGSHQQVELVSGDSTDEKNAVQAIGFQVRDAAEMRKYLLARGVKCGEITVTNSGDKFVQVQDPEGHRILFISSGGKAAVLPVSPISSRLIHAGLLVHDRAAEDGFYKDVLGFHVYWHGGMKDNETNWVDMQVPDGTDWLEYMLNVPPNPDHHTLGVMNHIALGVADIHAAREQLVKNGWKPSQEPQIGRDGKWQLNVYDPDDTRIELMEFKPVEKPCCSDYIGPHPAP